MKRKRPQPRADHPPASAGRGSLLNQGQTVADSVGPWGLGFPRNHPAGSSSTEEMKISEAKKTQGAWSHEE